MDIKLLWNFFMNAINHGSNENTTLTDAETVTSLTGTNV